MFFISPAIDLHHARELRAIFRPKVESKCAALVLELSGVDFIDSTGVAVIIEYLRDATAFGGQLCIAGLAAHVRHTFRIIALGKVVPIFDSLEESITALREGVPKVSQLLFGDAHREALNIAPLR